MSSIPPSNAIFPFLKEIHQAFGKYNYRDVCGRINLLRMEPNESVEKFSNRFLHLCYEISEEDLNWDFLKQEFERLVRVSSYSEPEPLDFSSSPTLTDHEAPQIVEEEPNTTFVPCPPPFLVPMWVPPCSDCKVEESAQHVPNPSSHLSPMPMEEFPKWLREPITKTHSSIPQEDITIHNSSLEVDLPLCHRRSFTSHDSLYHDSLDQSVSPARCVHSLDS